MANKFVAGIIGILLIIAAIGGLVFLFNKIEPSLSSTDSTTAITTDVPVTNIPSTNSPSTSAPSTSAPDDNIDKIVYASGVTAGYSVVNDYTYFFFFFDNDSSKRVFWKASNLQDESNYDIKPYGDYDLFIASSYDGVDWELDEYDFHEFSVASGYRLYVSYTRIFNCKNPDYVLEDLKQNVFSNENYFNWRIENAAG